jgi:hypothetical protein
MTNFAGYSTFPSAGPRVFHGDQAAQVVGHTGALTDAGSLSNAGSFTNAGSLTNAGPDDNAGPAMKAGTHIDTPKGNGKATCTSTGTAMDDNANGTPNSTGDGTSQSVASASPHGSVIDNLTMMPQQFLHVDDMGVVLPQQASTPRGGSATPQHGTPARSLEMPG